MSAKNGIIFFFVLFSPFFGFQMFYFESTFIELLPVSLLCCSKFELNEIHMGNGCLNGFIAVANILIGVNFWHFLR